MSDPQTVTRRRASEITGIACGTLRNWASARPPRGPRCIKLGPDPRSRTLYPLAEIRSWLRDPADYERRQEKRHGRHR
jgi:hypothetical protein